MRRCKKLFYQRKKPMSKSIFGAEKRPILTIVMDGVGYTERTAGNAVYGADTPTLDMLNEKYPRFLRLFVKNVGSMAKGGIWE